MKVSSYALTVFLLSCGESLAFTGPSSIVSVSTSTSNTFGTVPSAARQHPASCWCGACVGRTLSTSLFMSDASTPASPEEIVPEAVEALDGVLSEDEQHNTERPARKSLKKKGPKGKPLSEFTVGQMVTGRVKSLLSYGAFVDIGAETDALLHISQLSMEYVGDVKDVLEDGKEYEVRITKIDEGKKQVALSLLTEQQEVKAAQDVADRSSKRGDTRKSSSNNSNNSQRNDNSGLLSDLLAKGWDSTQFVEGTVVSIVDFGAFVNIDCKLLNSEMEGVLDGLVHISALAANRVNAVKDIVRMNEKVQVRVKGIENGKVSLSMVSVEDEQSKEEARGGGGGGQPAQYEGAKDWKESLQKMQAVQPTFTNKAVVVDLRK